MSAPSTMRRFQDHTPPFVAVKRLDAGHPAARDGHTLYRARVVSAAAQERLLKSGHNSRKIGRLVTKGAWRGLPIWTLTLEERATCPRDCAHWLTCFGNKMNWARRIAHGPALEARLADEVAQLAREHPGGFVVRLHVLGDFYSVAYVELWARLLDRHPGLHIFGYTARDPFGDPIGRRLEALSRTRWDRFAMRFSNRWMAERSALTLFQPGGVPARQGIVCPAQTGRAACCATCALCWGSRRNIFFMVH